MAADSDPIPMTPARETALACLEAGIEATLPTTVLPTAVSREGSTLVVGDNQYDLEEYERVVVVGGGKAAGELAVALEGVLGDWITEGVVVSTTTAETDTVAVVVGGHPIPDEDGVMGTEQILELVSEAGSETLVCCLITGGGSALLPAPAVGVSLEAVQWVTTDLLQSGATIEEVNCVRKHLSKLKGGQLARACAPATVVGLVISDVVGDNLDVIASGPLVADPTTFEEALEICEQYQLSLPAAVRAHLEAGVEGSVAETPGPDASFFERVSITILANGQRAIQAAASVATDRGYNTLVLSSQLEGEAREIGKTHAAIAHEIRATGNPLAPPAVVLSGGETTVTVTGEGRGGPNQEFAVSASLGLSVPDAVIGAIDTDGIDGRSDAAGAIVDAETATPPSGAKAALETNNVTPFLAANGGLVQTGPTGTNVNDLHVIVVPETD